MQKIYKEISAEKAAKAAAEKAANVTQNNVTNITTNASLSEVLKMLKEGGGDPTPIQAVDEVIDV
jgi:hypothetical protein